MQEALLSCGLQLSDRLGHTEHGTSATDAAKLWRALERACDPNFVVDLPSGVR